MPTRLGAAASWAAWITFVVLYALALVPFIQAGLQQLPSESFEYSGRHYEHFGIPYAPDAIDVYGSNSTAVMASCFVMLAPCLYLSAPMIIFWQIINHWYEDSRNRRRAKTLLLLLSLLALGFSTVIASKFVGWSFG
jgi:uncharacterized membrane protein